MPVFKDTVHGLPDAEDEVTVRVTKRGHGKVSTGNHDAKMGEEFFAEGDTFSIARSLADVLADENGDRRYVEITKTAVKA